ncbi:hypothetical protein R1flu_008021 [Riccia fluitans]|uniref:Protein kinase domain-containing protein n=1 Tax=Riccia fluitans TaxID=41844 RepID=A0ABD1YAV1_9MARC
MRKQYWTPGIDEGRKRFENKLVELGTIAFAQQSIAPDTRDFEHYTFKVELRLRKCVTQASTQWVEEFDTWIKSQFDEWTSERPDHFFPSILQIAGKLDPYRLRAESWQEWFKKPERKLVNLNSLSFRYKECEPISDNKIHWINFMSWVTPMLKRCRLSAGVYDGALRFPSEDLEKYDADHRLHASIFQCHRLKIAATLLQGLAFIHGHGWLHCDIHFRNVLVHFPLWDWDDKGLHNRIHDNAANDGARITRKLVFVGISDLRYAQTIQDALQGIRCYDPKQENPRQWIAPELTEKMAFHNSNDEKYVTTFIQSIDLFAMGWLLKQICGNFSTNMSKDKKERYDEEKWKMEFPRNSAPPHQTHRDLL